MTLELPANPILLSWLSIYINPSNRGITENILKTPETRFLAISSVKKKNPKTALGDSNKSAQSILLHADRIDQKQCVPFGHLTFQGKIGSIDQHMLQKLIFCLGIYLCREELLQQGTARTWGHWNTSDRTWPVSCLPAIVIGRVTNTDYPRAHMQTRAHSLS